MIFDSHAHYNDRRFDEDRFDILDAMPGENVGYIMNVADSMKSLHDVVGLAEKYSYVWASVGVHPEESVGLSEADMDVLERYAENEKVRAIGEIGLDYYYDDVEKSIQKKWFERQIELAKKVKLPIIVHDRDAHGDCLDILRATGARDAGGIVHCFSGSRETAREVLDMGMYIGIGGTLTFKNARRAREVAEYVPIDRIVLETDCPYLAPEPYRGKRNDSRLIYYIAEKLAEIKGIFHEDVEKITCENAKRCYGIED